MALRSTSDASVAQATVVRILSGRHPQASFQNVAAIAGALGLAVEFRPIATVAEMRRNQAAAKARRLVGLVQGTSGLEAQAVDPRQLDDLTEQATNELLAGSRLKLWRL
jgi:hypothetical protein